MLRRLSLAAAIAVLVSGVLVNRMYGRAGDLSKPEIAIASADGTPDKMGVAINRILMAHEKQFVRGHYINAHSVLQFAGGTKTINALLDELSKVEGVTLYVRFSKLSGEDGFVERPAGAGADLPKAYDCQIEHNNWADSRALNITICLGGDVAPQDIAIPAIQGRAADKSAP
jgi:hypothetical protein